MAAGEDVRNSAEEFQHVGESYQGRGSYLNRKGNNHGARFVNGGRLRELQHVLDREHDSLELLSLCNELLLAGRGERVVARAPIVLGRPPFRLHPAVEQQPLQRWIERALADTEHVFGELANAARDAVAVHRLAEEGAEDQEVEGPGQQLGCAISHRPSHRLSMVNPLAPRLSCQSPIVRRWDAWA